MFQKVLLNSLCEFLIGNYLLCEHQSGFGSSDSCEYQVLSIVRGIYSSFDWNSPVDIRGVFLDVSKAFAGVWHDERIHKIRCVGINVMVLKLIKRFLENGFQRVLLNS